MLNAMKNPDTAPAIEAAILLTRESAAHVVEQLGHKRTTDSVAATIRRIDLGLRS